MIDEYKYSRPLAVAGFRLPRCADTARAGCSPLYVLPGGQRVTERQAVAWAHRNQHLLRVQSMMEAS